nr:response regulator [uncultured Holophaga sp.]
MGNEYTPTPDNPGRILVVDDLPGNLKVITMELKRYPFALTTCSSAEEAIAICADTAFEGILMDVSMPVVDGIEACRRIRAHPLNARTPLIFLSAVRIGTDWITEGIEAGGIDYLVKPYALPELLAKLRMLVRLSRQDQAALAGERHRALLEVAGGTAHELAQPLTKAQLMLEKLLRQEASPTREQLGQLHDCLEETTGILRQIQNLNTYITKPYAQGQILDLVQSSRNPHK